jgi:hypothetical protein
MKIVNEAKDTRIFFKDAEGHFRVVDAPVELGVDINEQRKARLIIERETNLRVKGAVLSIVK